MLTIQRRTCGDGCMPWVANGLRSFWSQGREVSGTKTFCRPHGHEVLEASILHAAHSSGRLWNRHVRPGLGSCCAAAVGDSVEGAERHDTSTIGILLHTLVRLV